MSNTVGSDRSSITDRKLAVQITDCANTRKIIDLPASAGPVTNAFLRFIKYTRLTDRLRSESFSYIMIYH